jgi:hypothetical protein
MDYLEFKLWKLVVFLVIIAIYGFWKGFTGR